MVLRLLTVVLVSLSIATAQSYNKGKIDFRLWDDIEQSLNNASATSTSKFFKSNGGVKSADVIVYSTSVAEARNAGIEPISVYENFYTAKITADQMMALSDLQSTVYIEAPKMRYPKLNVSLVEMKVDKLHAGQVNSTAYKGSGVIVGIIDSGIDWKHHDFRSDSDTTKSRILFLRDMTTGKEFTQTQINNELDGTPANVVDEEDFSGHGTHVASTAAGDGSASSGTYKGVAPEADLIIVKAGDEGFSTTNIINGITYIRQKAVAAGKSFVINMSLGGHDGAHDGTSAEEAAVESELSTAGRQIVIAAGNEGSDPIYGGATLAQSANKVFTVDVPSFTPNAGAANDFVYLTMWYKNGDNFTVSVKTPDNTTVQAATGASQNVSTANGQVHIVNGTGAVNSKGAKECFIEIYDADAGTTPTVSTSWTITVTAGSVPQGGTFDIWLAASSMGAEFLTGNSFSKLVGMPGTAEGAITVGAYVTKWSWSSLAGNVGYSGADRTNNFSTFSSMGPTRDGRQKPDVSAPGQAIAAARSSSAAFSNQLLLAPGGKYVIEQGTSMASPHVAGLVALMLQAKPTLTAAQIRSALRSTSRTDGNVGTVPNAQWGYGKVDAQAVLQNILSVRLESEIVPKKFILNQNYPNPFNPSTKISFSIPSRAVATVKVYSVLGEEIASLVNEELAAGEYSTQFDASQLSSGMYFYTLSAGSFSQTKKMLLVR
ncbi:MAG: S8 family peptidase [Ignavibacteriales bacterium]|nr:S8 family peptidase [Ignavibacteriales bacterium]